MLAEETPDALPRLDLVLEILARGGREAIAAQVRPTEAYRRFLDDALDRAKEGVAAARSIAEHPMPANFPKGM